MAQCRRTIDKIANAGDIQKKNSFRPIHFLLTTSILAHALRNSLKHRVGLFLRVAFLYHCRVILTDKDVLMLTGLEGFRGVNHRMRKSMLIDLVRRHFPVGAKIADIGCAAGDLTMELQGLGYQLTGVEFEPERLDRARTLAARYGLDVRFVARDLTEWAEEGEFDGFIMGEILEHFIEPRILLEKHLKRLKPGGKVIVTVPNMASLRARLKLAFFGEFADHNREHRYYFTRRRFVEHFDGLPIAVVEMFTFLFEVTHSASVTLAAGERAMLSPMKWLMPWSGTHLVVVLQRRSS